MSEEKKMLLPELQANCKRYVDLSLMKSRNEAEYKKLGTLLKKHLTKGEENGVVVTVLEKVKDKDGKFTDLEKKVVVYLYDRPNTTSNLKWLKSDGPQDFINGILEAFKPDAREKLRPILDNDNVKEAIQAVISAKLPKKTVGESIGKKEYEGPVGVPAPPKEDNVTITDIKTEGKLDALKQAANDVDPLKTLNDLAGMMD
jgi:hypothetical protein